MKFKKIGMISFLLSCCISINTFAASDREIENRKMSSHGVFEFIDEKTKSKTVIDTNDLYSLSEDINELNNRIKNMKKFDGIEVVSESVKESNDEFSFIKIPENGYYTDITYLKINNEILCNANEKLWKSKYDAGYSVGYTEGLKKATAPKNGKIVYKYHTHSSSCYTSCPGYVRQETRYTPEGNDYVASYCTYTHGTGKSHYSGSFSWNYSGKCPCTILGCGKTTSSIESATIVFE